MKAHLYRVVPGIPELNIQLDRLVAWWTGIENQLQVLDSQLAISQIVVSQAVVASIAGDWVRAKESFLTYQTEVCILHTPLLLPDHPQQISRAQDKYLGSIL